MSGLPVLAAGAQGATVERVGHVPFCTGEVCTHYDGKRCALIGMRPGNVCQPTVESDAEERDAEITRLRALIREAIVDLVEHTADGTCAGPRGTGRRGACHECRIAAALNPEAGS